MDNSVYIVIGAVALAVVWIISAAVKICKEYERLVVFRLGRFVGVRGPGWVLIWPFIERVERRVDMRVLTLDVPAEEIITRDNVTIKVNAVLYFQVIDAQKAVINVANYVAACLQIAQTTLRDVVGQSELDEYVKAYADEVGRVVLPNPTPEKGSFFRSDHFPFAKQGVPALSAGSGVQHRERARNGALSRSRNISERNITSRPMSTIPDGTWAVYWTISKCISR